MGVLGAHRFSPCALQIAVLPPLKRIREKIGPAAPHQCVYPRPQGTKRADFFCFFGGTRGDLWAFGLHLAAGAANQAQAGAQGCSSATSPVWLGRVAVPGDGPLPCPAQRRAIWRPHLSVRGSLALAELVLHLRAGEVMLLADEDVDRLDCPSTPGQGACHRGTGTTEHVEGHGPLDIGVLLRTRWPAICARLLPRGAGNLSCRAALDSAHCTVLACLVPLLGRQGALGRAPSTAVLACIALIIFCHRWRGNIVTSSPD